MKKISLDEEIDQIERVEAKIALIKELDDPPTAATAENLRLVEAELDIVKDWLILSLRREQRENDEKQ